MSKINRFNRVLEDGKTVATHNEMILITEELDKMNVEHFVFEIGYNKYLIELDIKEEN